LWEERRGANVNFERYIRREVLGGLNAPLVWGLDEVDRLFATAYGGEVFGLFRSWHNARAIHYRKMNGIPDSLGTAVNVQAMVFGNLGDSSATGVAFTRNPSTGAREIYGEFLVNAQGEPRV
jgi:hypothetical protein